MSRHVLRADDESPQERAAQRRRLRESFRLHEARVDGMDVDASRAELGGGGAREGELRVLGGRVRARRGERDRARDRDDVDDVGASRGFEPRQERTQ